MPVYYGRKHFAVTTVEEPNRELTPKDVILMEEYASELSYYSNSKGKIFAYGSDGELYILDKDGDAFQLYSEDFQILWKEE